MSKKNSNLITLRKSTKYITSVTNNHTTHKDQIILQNLIKLFNKKGYWIFKIISYKNKLNFKLNIVIYITKKKIFGILNKKKQKKKFFKQFLTLKLLKLKSYLFNIAKCYNYIIKLTILNKKVNKYLCIKYNKILLKYKSSLFIRRHLFYYDFLKVFSIASNYNLPIQNYLNLFSVVFKYLIKTKHNKFFLFLLSVMKLLIKYNKSLLKINGFKMRINGRLKGKLRAATKIIYLKSTPTQTLNKNIEYAFSPIFTRYGAFGMHLWVFKK
jgi:hypothetical protein